MAAAEARSKSRPVLTVVVCDMPDALTRAHAMAKRMEIPIATYPQPFMRILERRANRVLYLVTNLSADEMMRDAQVGTFVREAAERGFEMEVALVDEFMDDEVACQWMLAGRRDDD